MNQQIASSSNADLLIYSRWIATVDDNNTLLENSAVAIKDGKIIAVMNAVEAKALFPDSQAIHLNDHLLIPGLINAHGHTGMTLLRGYADDLPLQTWLGEHIWPAEHAFVSPDFVKTSSQLAFAEMLKSGTTCFADMYFFPEATLQAVEETGIRAHLVPPVFDFPSNWQQKPGDYLSAIVELITNHKPNTLVSFGFGPHAPYTVSDDTFLAVLDANKALNLGLHIHLHETAQEITDSLAQFGKRPVKRLYDLGALTDKTQCVHMTQIDDEDISLLQKTGASVIHCPRSNMKLASGGCPVDRLLEASINVGLGTDSAASNNALNMISEMTQAAMLAKIVSAKADAVSAVQALRIATINSAKALGLASKIGSIEIGKDADLCAVDLSDLYHQPVYSPLSALIYGETQHKVSDVWVAGQQLLESGKLTQINEQSLRTDVNQWRDKISKSSR